MLKILGLNRSEVGMFTHIMPKPLDEAMHMLYDIFDIRFSHSTDVVFFVA